MFASSSNFIIFTHSVPQAKQTEVNENDSDSHSTHELENNAECVRMHNLEKKFNFI